MKVPVGIDTFFFRADILTVISRLVGRFRLGLPWWDFYLPTACACRNIATARYTPALFYHRIHDQRWNDHAYRDMHQEFLRLTGLSPQTDVLIYMREHSVACGGTDQTNQQKASVATKTVSNVHPTVVVSKRPYKTLSRFQVYKLLSRKSAVGGLRRKVRMFVFPRRHWGMIRRRR